MQSQNQKLQSDLDNLKLNQEEKIKAIKDSNDSNETRLLAELSMKDAEMQDLNDMIEIKDQDLR